MRSLLIVLMVATTPAMACNANMISIETWQASKEDGWISLSATYRYEGERPIRMIDGSLVFGDALGGLISAAAIDRDAHLDPGDTSEIQLRLMPEHHSRLVDIAREDILATSCVRAVVYEDGTKEEFQ